MPEPNWGNHTLWTGDNLEVMHGMNDDWPILVAMRGWALWLGLAMAVALAACGGAEPAPMPAPPTATPTAVASASATPTASPTPAPTVAPTAVASASATPMPTPTASPTPAPVVMRYGAPASDGVVDEAGEYAFLAADGSAVTTYGGLRQDAARLVIHERDADGESWAAFYDAVAAGDHFEWREADDCWVRYFVDDAPPAPADAPVRVFGVRRYGYAYTGCDGAIAATGERAWTWAPPGVRSPDVAVPVRHGPWLLVPRGDWSGVLEDMVQVRSLAVGGADGTAWHPRPFPEPRVPEGWTGGVGIAPHGYLEGFYSDEEGFALLITIALRYYLPMYEYTGEGVGPDAYVQEIRIIDGRTALLRYSAEPRVITSTFVSIYDNASGIEYITGGYASGLRNDIEATIEIARTLVPIAP